MDSGKEAYERGLKEGALIARVDEAFVRLNKINGSVERHADSVESLTRAVNSGLEKLASEIRTMKGDARIRDERVEAAREALALEAKTAGSRWSLRANKATVASGLIAVGLAASTIYLSFH